MHKHSPLVCSSENPKVRSTHKVLYSRSVTEEAFPSTTFLGGVAFLILCSGLLALLRVVSNISFFEPLHLITSGSEEQSFLSLWKFIHGQPVYTDPHKIPFTSSYLNWLFYGFYGVFIKATLAWTALSDAWIPTVGRLITLLFSVTGIFVARRILRELFLNPSQKTKLLFDLVSFYLFFGPLPAFWPLTTRPDMAAMVFELLAFYFFIKEFERHPNWAALTAAFFSFIAWSFKQTNITIFLGLVVFCLLRKRRAAGLMGFTMVTLCFLALWLGGSGYRESTLFSLPVPGFSPVLGLENFFYYLAECAFAVPGYAAMGVVFFSKALRDKIRNNQAYQLCFILALVASMVGGITSLKIGASENYFIPAGIFVTFFFFCVIAVLPRNGAIWQLLHVSFYFSWVVNVLLVFAILFGIKGHVSKRYEHEEALALVKCSKSLSRPVFSQTAYLNLPWMLGGEAFIPGYTYWVENGREKVYEQGGIEGLIRQGYFGSLLLEKRRINEIVGESGIEKQFRSYVESSTSGCPSTHTVFIKAMVN
ncbi:MAG: hypothetical protein HYS55_03905 [Candidatus Omnitrophica bacterium]|nr:hypothetical protein [Candidatus Omnitrophota bacterium]